MKTLLLATHNPAKIKRYRALFANIAGLELKTLADLSISHKCEEPFAAPEENAIHKAKEYAKLTGLATLAIDEALTTNFLPDNEQPGVMVRRLYGGRELSDEEVLAAWKEILNRYPREDKLFIWDYWLAYHDPVTGDTRTAQALKPSTVAKEFSRVLHPGYPMSSFLIPPGSNRPFSELSDEERLTTDVRYLKPFAEMVRGILEKIPVS